MSFTSAEQEVSDKTRFFHIIGFDILLDSNGDPSLLELNALPNMSAWHEGYVSEVDLYVNSRAYGHAVELAMKSTEELENL